jgi:choline dehydrogenase-like flavoprotein
VFAKTVFAQRIVRLMNRDNTTVETAVEEQGQRYDVIVVGSGAGGSTLAYQLALNGHRVLVIERGSYLRPGRKNASDSVGIYMGHLVKNRDGPPFFVGGQTKFYGAALYRMRESDFQAVEHEKGISPSWPITYSEIEPYYERAEALYCVHGSTNGDLSEPPRARPFPYPPIEHAPIVSKLAERIEHSGTRVSAIPLGLDYRPEGRCVLCSTCDGYYCQLGAKMDAEIAALRPALATGNVRLMTETDCVRVLTTKDGSRTIGILIRHLGREQEIHADAVAICTGLTSSTTLLRRSRNQKHPEGLGNATGCLGRYLAGHSAGLIFPFMGWKRMPATYTKTFAINGYYNGAPEWPYPTGTIQLAGQMPFWEEAPRPLRPLAHFVGTHTLMCFYMTEALPTRDTGLIFDGDEIINRVPPVQNLETFSKLRDLAVDIFRQAGHRVLIRRRPPYIWHEVGTARFGADPATSVVDPNCQVHGIEGLFVVDASVLPTAGAVNTALTIIALALRAGDHISRNL